MALAPRTPSPNGKSAQGQGTPGGKSRSSRTGGQVRAPRQPSDKAIVLSGCEGKYTLINGTYEPTGMHRNFPCWTSRNNTPCYLFHTGRTRWVISKDLDDGTTCYAFIQDDGSENPAGCKGQWTRCSDNGEWKQDPQMTCKETAFSVDPFVRVRMSLEAEMKKVRISEESDRERMWKKLDRSGDHSVDMSEVETLVADLVRTGVWPHWLDSERALRRAYDRTLAESLEGDDVIEKADFHALLLNIFWFGKLDQIFQEIDTNSSDDEHLNFDEFAQGMVKLGVKLSDDEAKAEFAAIDKDGSNSVDFSEFCLFVRKRVQPECSNGHTEHDDKKAEAHEAVRTAVGHAVTAGSMVRKKNFADFDKLEKKIKAICNDSDQKGLKRLWQQLDNNGNNIVSLAEIDKWVVEQYPILNHKPALMGAQKATLKEGANHEWVVKKSFKLLLGNLFYYNKLFWLFDQADQGDDRRMDFSEFQFCLSMAGVKLSPNKAKQEFNKVDANGGGQILFDEFCQYFVSKQCPEAMADFIEDGDEAGDAA